MIVVASASLFFASARSNRWTARARSSISSPTADPSRRISICRCSTPANRMLAAMRRPYTIEHYAALVDDIRARMPHASIGSDVIVGFPGRDRRGLRPARVVSRTLAADARPRVSVLGSARHRGDVDERQGAGRRRFVSADAAIREMAAGADSTRLPASRRSGASIAA